jgi:hypothetical protein
MQLLTFNDYSEQASIDFQTTQERQNYSSPGDSHHPLIWSETLNRSRFRLKDVKELPYAAFGKITKDVWTKAEEHVIKIEKEYCKENCIDRSVRNSFNNYNCS